MWYLRRCLVSFYGLSKSSGRTLCTVSKEEVGRFSELADDWWNEKGSLKALHSLNDLRVPWIRDTLISQEKLIKYDVPLENLKILDAGCGAGILCEPLSRLGASVTGIDASEECVSVAKAHADKDPKLRGRIRYLTSSVEGLLSSEEGQYHGVVASEVLEHVDNPGEFVKGFSINYGTLTLLTWITRFARKIPGGNF